jgi:hypothetical protein
MVYMSGLWACVAVATENDLLGRDDVNFSIDTPVEQQWYCGYTWSAVLPFDLVDGLQTFLKLLAAGDGDHAGGLVLDQETDCQPATRGNTHSPVSNFDSGGTQLVDGALDARTPGAVQSLLGYFAWTVFAGAQAVREQQHAMRKGYLFQTVDWVLLCHRSTSLRLRFWCFSTCSW